MAERWQQWMPFHIDRWRGSAHVQAMRAAARAGYLYLLASAWQSEDCSLPDENEELQILAGVSEEEWAEHGARILRRFTRRVDGRYVNEVLLAEWTSAKAVYDKRHKQFDEVRASRSAAGKRGAERRWNRQGERGEERAEVTESTPPANEWQTAGKRMANELQAHDKPTAGDGSQEHGQEQRQRIPDSCETKAEFRETRRECSERAGLQDGADCAVPVSPIFLALPLAGSKPHRVTEDEVAGYQQAYPAVDVRAELRKMLPWLEANPW